VSGEVDAALSAAVRAAVSVPVVVELGAWAQMSSKVGLGGILTSQMAGVLCELPASRQPAAIQQDVADSKALLQKASPTIAAAAAPPSAAAATSSGAPIQLMSDADEALVAEEKALLTEVGRFDVHLISRNMSTSLSGSITNGLVHGCCDADAGVPPAGGAVAARAAGAA
jgi:hypothetical protein